MKRTRLLFVLGLALVLAGCGEHKPVRTAAAPEARTWLTNEENGAITYGDPLPKPKDVAGGE